MNVTFTDRVSRLGPYSDKFSENGINTIFMNSTNEDEFDVNTLKNTDALLVWHAKITEKTIQHLDKCKIVIRFGIGYDQVDGKALRKKGISLANNPYYCIDEVSDTAIGMIITMTRNICRHNNLARSYKESWQENNLDSVRTASKKVGLIGLGKIGTSTALKLKALGYNVSAYDPYIEDGNFRSLSIGKVDNLNELLNTSDIVSLHCPLTKETTGLVDDDFLKQMKKNAILINTARGKIIHSLDVLRQHMIKNTSFKAALDVLPVEPPPVSEKLINDWRIGSNWLNERLIINPHNSYHSSQSSIDQFEHAYNTLFEALIDGSYKNIVN